MNVFERHLEDPRRLARLKKLGCAALVLIVLGELAVLALGLAHGHFGFEEWPAFGSLYGLFSCVVIVVVSKFIGHRWLMKKEDYYD